VRIVPLILLAAATCWAADAAFGTWKLNAARSIFAGVTQPNSLTVRIEPHAKGEVFTLDRTEANGRSTSCSVLLYFDGMARTFEDAGCSGTQSSRRVDSQTVEILRKCASSGWTWLVRRPVQSKELILDITEQRRGGRHFEWRMVLEKQ
jgi:hypothetical protein